MYGGDCSSASSCHIVACRADARVARTLPRPHRHNKRGWVEAARGSAARPASAAVFGRPHRMFVAAHAVHAGPWHRASEESGARTRFASVRNPSVNHHHHHHPPIHHRARAQRPSPRARPAAAATCHNHAPTAQGTPPTASEPQLALFHWHPHVTATATAAATAAAPACIKPRMGRRQQRARRGRLRAAGVSTSR